MKAQTGRRASSRSGGKRMVGLAATSVKGSFHGPLPPQHAGLSWGAPAPPCGRQTGQPPSELGVLGPLRPDRYAQRPPATGLLPLALRCGSGWPAAHLASSHSHHCVPH